MIEKAVQQIAGVLDSISNVLKLLSEHVSAQQEVNATQIEINQELDRRLKLLESK